MFVTFSVFFLLFESKEVVSVLQCPSLRLPRHGVVTCTWDKQIMSCSTKLPVGSVAEFVCNEFYKSSSEENSVKCLHNGSWSANAPKCVPVITWESYLFGSKRVKSFCHINTRWKFGQQGILKHQLSFVDCGRRFEIVSLVVNGVVAPRGSFPWHVALYNFIDGKHEYWCGGSLISDVVVITAAHCVWEVSTENLVVALGKFHREFDIEDKNSQKRKAKKIEMLRTYQDVVGNYNGDLAIILLQEPIRLGHLSSPVCMDWDHQLMDTQLTEGNTGLVAGWGLTENDTFGDYLRTIKLPVVSDEKCIANQELDFRKFITYTTFCAGFANGSGVCNGDSGGGLAFFDEVSGRWYLQGVVSVSPRRKGTPFCDPYFYTVFTKIGMFSKWLKAWEDLEGGNQLNNNASKNLSSVPGRYFIEKGKKLIFPHSQKLLELARHSKRPGTIN